MTNEQIEKWIKEAHENAIERGFYSCPECYGTGECKEDVFMCDKQCLACSIGGCKTCNGTGIDPNKNIGELLMLIVSELGEALEAHRCGRFAEKSQLVIISDYTESHDKEAATMQFERFIKDTFEDEIADVFIRLFDLCGYKNINPEIDLEGLEITNENLGVMLLSITYYLSSMESRLSDKIELCLNALVLLSQHFNIPIEKHITAKMAYNRTRPHKHGKAY